MSHDSKKSMGLGNDRLLNLLFGHYKRRLRVILLQFLLVGTLFLPAFSSCELQVPVPPEQEGNRWKDILQKSLNAKCRTSRPKAK